MKAIGEYLLGLFAVVTLTVIVLLLVNNPTLLIGYMFYGVGIMIIVQVFLSWIHWRLS